VIVSLSDAAARLRVHLPTMRTWRYRYVDFPTPINVVEIGGTAYFNLADIARWFERRQLVGNITFGLPKREGL
jgi:hypothetical protein